jgi:hypothetical protein
MPSGILDVDVNKSCTTHVLKIKLQKRLHDEKIS